MNSSTALMWKGSFDEFRMNLQAVSEKQSLNFQAWDPLQLPPFEASELAEQQKERVAQSWSKLRKLRKKGLFDQIDR